MPNVKLIKVMLIDNHALVRAGLCLLIESHPNLKIIAEANNRAEALSNVRRTQPDVILLELSLGPDRGLELLPELLRAAPHARVLILTDTKDAEAYLQALCLGAKGIITKDQTEDKLIQAIRNIHAGEAWLDGVLTDQVLTQLRHSSVPDAYQAEDGKMAALTPRERQIIQLVCEGFKNQLIADRLRMSEGTVRNHLTVIYEKLGVKDRFGLIVFANHHRVR